LELKKVNLKNINDQNNMKFFNPKFFYDHYLERIFIGFLLFYLFNSFLIKLFKYLYKVDLILPALTILKVFLFLFYLMILILNFKKRRKIFVYTAFLLLVFIVANFKWDLNVISIWNSYKSTSSMNFFYFVKYLYPFFFIGVFSLIKDKQEAISRYFEIIETALIINIIFVVFGFLFSIDFFQSYMRSSRFGYSGLLEFVFFQDLLIIVISRRLFLDKIDLKFVMFSIASLFIGTKAIILFFVLLIFYYLYEKGKIKLLVLYSGLLISTLVFIKPIVNFFAMLFPFWQPLLAKYGYLTLLTSTRDWKIQKTLEHVEVNSSLKNLFVGIEEFSKYVVEMDFIDLFLFFGIIGGVIYLLFLSRFINKSYHLIPFIIGFFSGNFLFSTITISICFIWMYESYTEQKGGILNENVS
jgi:hypothetical protein